MINDIIPRDWLHRKGTPEDFEREELERKAAVFNIPFEKLAQKLGSKPFGLLTDKWHEFIKTLEPDDELWLFSSPDETFAKRLGCKGFAIVRGGVVRDTFVTLRI